MAGSNTWRTYQTDSGVLYSILVAKHVAEAIGRGGAIQSLLFDHRSGNYPALPAHYSPRYVYARPVVDRSILKKVKSRKLLVGSYDVWKALRNPFNSIEFSSGVHFNQSRFWVVTGYGGETEILAPRPDVFG